MRSHSFIGEYDDHIGVATINANGVVQSFPDAVRDIRTGSSNTGRVWIDYDGTTTTLKVYHTLETDKPANPIQSSPNSINLASLLSSGTTVNICFTSGTGGVTDNHDVLDWSFTELM